MFTSMHGCVEMSAVPEEISKPLQKDYRYLWATQLGCWKSNSSSLKEQYKLLTAEPSLQPSITILPNSPTCFKCKFSPMALITCSANTGTRVWDLVAQFNPGTQEAERFETSLLYRASLRAARAPQRNPFSKQRKGGRKEKPNQAGMVRWTSVIFMLERGDRQISGTY